MDERQEIVKQALSKYPKIQSTDLQISHILWVRIRGRQLLFNIPDKDDGEIVKMLKILAENGYINPKLTRLHFKCSYPTARKKLRKLQKYLGIKRKKHQYNWIRLADVPPKFFVTPPPPEKGEKGEHES